MKNVIALETYEEILNAHMHAEIPELGLYISASSNVEEQPKNKEGINYKIGELYSEYGVYAGINDEGKHLFVCEEQPEEEMSWKKCKNYCSEIAKKTRKPYRMPTLKELMLIFIHKDKINKELEEQKKEILTDNHYWSSTEYSDTSSWILSMYNGYINDYIKYDTVDVRPVLALEL